MSGTVDTPRAGTPHTGTAHAGSDQSTGITLDCAHDPYASRGGSGVTVLLPQPDNTVRPYELGTPVSWPVPQAPLTSRRVYAAAHVVPEALAENVPGAHALIDWDSTLAYRHRIWERGLGVADAMDTAQRNAGLDWSAVQELVRRSAAEARSVGGKLACGAGTDQLDLSTLPEGRAGLQAVRDAYREQIDLVAGCGATVVLMASRALVRVAQGPEDYFDLYHELLTEASEPVILHWLGPMFDPQLTGYWGHQNLTAATSAVAQLIDTHASKVDGIKMSLLDAQREIDLRNRLPVGVRMYTGDDFNYPELIVGQDGQHSDALLGVFAAIYPIAGTAIQALDAGDDHIALDLLTRTQQLGRHIFSAPTTSYKTGIALLSWLNGHQPAFSMLAGMQNTRSLPHLIRIAVLADQAGLLLDPDLTARRLRALLLVNGIEQ